MSLGTGSRQLGSTSTLGDAFYPLYRRVFDEDGDFVAVLVEHPAVQRVESVAKRARRAELARASTEAHASSASAPAAGTNSLKSNASSSSLSTGVMSSSPSMPVSALTMSEVSLS